MKKIIKSSVLLLGLYFFAAKVNAQLASDTPAITSEQVAKLIKERAVTTPVVTVVSTDVSKTTTKAIVARKRPALSDQGVVKPVLPSETTKPLLPSETTKPASADPVPVKVVEVKQPATPVQEEKVKTRS